ncbi:jg19944 [Pararge aegeria aegeria]|uniref:Jg19944 protein n=1 Tax=Pararge aegeria aegeria TaxID=348720 RepID=A0A8S4RY98_9NEOP|nr:jg19944 [Pararge aegeria aegeria]
MINGFTFSEYSPMFWYCTRKKSKYCQAKARTDAHGNLRFLEENHNHALVQAILRARLCRESTNIYIGGHKFFRHSRSLIGNRIRWTCSKKHKLKCKASAVTIDGVVVSTTGLHSHA